MAGGSLETVRGPKTRRVLAEIAARDGMTFSEIQRFVCEMNGVDYDAKDGLGRRQNRGYWCVMLSSHYACTRKHPPSVFRTGILERYCVKDGRKWRVR